MSNEAQFWRTVRRNLPPGAHFERMENLVAIGTPDVNFCWDGVNGWIELKYVSRWPKQDFNIITERLWKMEQRLWALRRIRAGGKCFLFVQVEREYLLFDSDILNTPLVLETCSKEKLISIALAYWINSIDVGEFKNALSF